MATDADRDAQNAGRKRKPPAPGSARGKKPKAARGPHKRKPATKRTSHGTRHAAGTRHTARHAGSTRKSKRRGLAAKRHAKFNAHQRHIRILKRPRKLRTPPNSGRFFRRSGVTHDPPPHHPHKGEVPPQP